MKYGLWVFIGMALATAVDAEEGFVRLQQPQEDRNRVRVGAMVLINANIEFKASPMSVGGVNPGPAAGGVDHFYDDGYVRVDSTGNAFPPGTTSYWGYDSASQWVDNPADPHLGPDSLAMHAAASVTSGFESEDALDPGLGVELAYGRVLGQTPRLTWGVEGLFGYVTLSQDTSYQGGSSVATVTDLYSLNVNGVLVTPPSAPYDGPYQAQPGSPLLNDSPSRTLTSVNGMTTAKREWEADLFSLRVGPFLDFALLERLTVGVGGGLAVALVDSTFSYREQLTYDNGAGPVTVSRSGEDDDFSTLLGGYIGVQARFDLTRYLGIYANGSYLGMGKLDISSGQEQVEVDFGGSFLISGGISLAF